MVRRFIKTSIGFLFAGIGLGLWLLARRELFGEFPSPYLVSAHVHAVFVGFVMFLILGVALWLFPRAEKGDGRYRPERIALAYWVLTVSTALRFLAELARGALSGGNVAGRTAPAGPLAWLVLLGGAGQAAGLALYFWTMWPRIRPVGSHLREAKGEKF